MLLYAEVKINFVFLTIRIPADISMEGNEDPGGFNGLHSVNDPREQLFGGARTFSKDSRGTHASTTHSSMSKQLDVEELEMLLEAYFVQIDGTLNKLSTVSTSTFYCYINLF